MTGMVGQVGIVCKVCLWICSIIVLSMPSLSVIIPTHRRPEILKTCLEHLEKQTIVNDIEVIVVSDGGDDESQVVRHKSPAFACGLRTGRQVTTRFLEIAPCHQGVARNEGVKVAQGKYVMFIGDDIFLTEDACAKHVQSYTLRLASLTQGESFATLGFTTWDPACGITPMMRWLEISGWQFGYPQIEKFSHNFLPRDIQHKYTYTSHISLPIEIAKKFPFRSDVSLYGWEDVEWGMRLRDAGVPLFYEPSAIALHHHHITLDDSLKRMQTLGRSAVEIQKKVPEFDRVPRGWKLLAYRICALFPAMAGSHRRAFLRGLGVDS